MIDNEEEYRRMFEVEQKLWWYGRLHRMVLKNIRQQFEDRQIRILDAACGTGGLLSYLHAKGYKNCSGFDASAHAVKFSKDRQLDVDLGDLRKVNAFRPEQTYDVICCNDALYFLTDEEISDTLRQFKSSLVPNGMILINIHAFQVFAGTHDLAVGSSRRFTLKDFQKLTKDTGLQITHSTYWPFTLALPISLVRGFQRLQIKRGAYRDTKPESDVKYPGDFINNTLEKLMRFEEKWLPRAPFGSSLFMQLKPEISHQSY